MAASGLFSNFPRLQEAIHGISPKDNTDQPVVETESKIPPQDRLKSSTENGLPRPGSRTSECESEQALIIDAPEPVDDTPSTSQTPSPFPSTIIKSESPSIKSLFEDAAPMYVDPKLPPGWSRRLTQRTMGASAGKYDVYIFSPDKKKIRSKTDLMLYLARNDLDLDPDEFDFTVRGRHNTPVKRPPTSKPRTSSPKKPRVTVPKPLKVEKLKIDKIKMVTIKQAPSRQTSNTANSRSVNSSKTASDAQSHSSSGPKLIVKFNFPIPQMKRRKSMNSKKSDSKKSKKKKTAPVAPAPLSRQDSQTSQSSQTNVIETFEDHEVLPNGEARLHNGLDIDDVMGIRRKKINKITNGGTGHIIAKKNDDSLSESDIFM